MRRPRAILFDYGGVLADVHHLAAGFTTVARHVADMLDGALPVADVETDLRAGARAYEDGKRAASRLMRPRELSHREFWELVAGDWPAGARTTVFENADALCERFESATMARPAKRDSRDTLLALRKLGVRTGLVCNCISAEAARRQLRCDALDELLDVEVFSDEEGVRKPNPEVMLAAVTAVHADPVDTWFVGDKYDRDILGARRAGLGRAVLMSSPAGPGEPPRGLVHDALVAAPSELLTLLP